MRTKISISETQLQTVILEYLRALGVACWRVNTTGVPNGRGGLRTNREMRGMADISLILPVNNLGVSVWLEVKTDKGKQSEHQKTFQRQVEAARGFYFVVRSIEDVQKAIQTIKGKNGSVKMPSL
jgi:hypothetical protein